MTLLYLRNLSVYCYIQVFIVIPVYEKYHRFLVNNLFQAQEEEERKKLEEEQARQRKEVEDFERKLEGRKHRRRNRHQMEPEMEPSLWQRQRWLLLGAAIVTIVAFFVYMVTSDD